MAACRTAIIASLRARRSSSRRASASSQPRLAAAPRAGSPPSSRSPARRVSPRTPPEARTTSSGPARAWAEAAAPPPARNPVLELRGRGCLFLIDARLGRLFPRRRLEQRVGEERRLRLRLRRRECAAEKRVFLQPRSPQPPASSRRISHQPLASSRGRTFRASRRASRRRPRRADQGHRPRAARGSRRRARVVFGRCEPDADLPALRVVARATTAASRRRGSTPGAGVFAFAAFAAEASSFPATEAGEIKVDLDDIRLQTFAARLRGTRKRDWSSESRLKPHAAAARLPRGRRAASARSARVLFFPEDAGCSGSVSFARAGASASARGALSPPGGLSVFCLRRRVRAAGARASRRSPCPPQRTPGFLSRTRRASCASRPVPCRGESRGKVSTPRRARGGGRFFVTGGHGTFFGRGKDCWTGEQTWSPRRWRR